MVTIRAGKEQDLPALLDIYNHIIVNTTAVYHYQPHTMEMRKAWYDARVKEGFPVFVAEDDGKVVGFCVGWTEWTGWLGGSWEGWVKGGWVLWRRKIGGTLYGIFVGSGIINLVEGRVGAGKLEMDMDFGFERIKLTLLFW